MVIRTSAGAWVHWRSVPPALRTRVFSLCFLLCCGPLSGTAQLRERIPGTINNNETTRLYGSAPPLPPGTNKIGPVSGDTLLHGVTIYFNPTAEQKAELDALVEKQQTPGSPLYHKWLSPAEYAQRFGLSEGDLAKVKSWLESQGFTIDRVANSHNSIAFSGAVSQVNAAFQTEIDSYEIRGKKHFANATELSIPQALSGIVRSVRNLNDFRPQPLVRFRRPGASFTSGQSGSHYLQPGDIAVIYDINAAYNAGYTGTGQSIAVVGQSYIAVSDIEHFQSAAGLTVKDPTLVLVPGSGTAQDSSGDEAESDLDLEYAGGTAKGAAIYFVYVGNNQNYSVFDSLQYAVDTRIAPVITMSYGACETDFSSSDFSTLESIAEQGASQGQSIIAASGDDGSTSCYGDTALTAAQQEALAVMYPASSAYVTGVGGTEFPASDVSTSNTTYWESASGNDVVTSAKSYILEQAWNDDATCVQYVSEGGSPLCSGGGGTSTLTARPSWQAGVAGIPSGSYRVVPDISLNSSPVNGGYLYCTSDSSAWNQGQQASCTSGFRDSSTNDLTAAGGTSFAAPIFAGMLAILNQKENSTGQGLLNSALYQLAASSSTYSSAFHDITSGGNQCTAGSTYCSSAGVSQYAATTGYDEATGLGSVDFNNFLSAWAPGSSSGLESTTTSLSPATTTPASGAGDAISVTVAPESASITTTPTGSLTIVVDGTTATSSLALSNGSATYTFSSSTAGSHVIVATYSGDSSFAGSTGSVTVDVGGSSGSSSPGTFTLSASNVTAAQGKSGASTVTVTSHNSYAGTVQFQLSTTDSSVEQYGCYGIANVAVAANQTATTTLTLYTSKSDCSSGSIRAGVRRSFARAGLGSSRELWGGRAGNGSVSAGFAAVFAILLLGKGRRRRTVVWTFFGWLLLMGALWIPLACGGSPAASDVPKGTYTLTLDGTDTANSSIAASTTLTLTVN